MSAVTPCSYQVLDLDIFQQLLDQSKLIYLQVPVRMLKKMSDMEYSNQQLLGHGACFRTCGTPIGIHPEIFVPHADKASSGQAVSVVNWQITVALVKCRMYWQQSTVPGTRVHMKHPSMRD